MSLRMRSANRELMRRMNEALVLGIIHDAGPIARTEIAERSGLSLATISGITGALIQQNIVVEQSAGESTGGRRPILLAINVRAAVAIGVKLTRETLVVAVADLGANLIELRSASLSEQRTPEAVIEALGQVIDSLRAEYPDHRFIGLGLGMAGIVDRDQGFCRYSPFLPWRNVPLRESIEQRISLPVIVENDVNALTIAERWFGVSAGSRNFLVVTLGRGVGMGLMLNGELYRGGRSGAGEFGHVTAIEGGRLCNCGRRGCVEAYVSEAALEEIIQTETGRSLPLNDAITLASDGDEELAKHFADAGHILGLTLSGVVNVLNPTRIIISGEGTRYVDLLMPALRSSLNQHCFDRFYDDLTLVVEPWGDDVWARGAAALMIDEFFHPADLRSSGVSATAAPPRSPHPDRVIPEPG